MFIYSTVNCFQQVTDSVTQSLIFTGSKWFKICRSNINMRRFMFRSIIGIELTTHTESTARTGLLYVCKNVKVTTALKVVSTEEL